MASLQEQEVLSVTLGNQTPYQMRFERSHVWKGNQILFPGTIPANGAATIVDLMDNEGSKAFGMYSGRNASGVACAWLCAWDAHVKNVKPTGPDKVFVICGPKERIISLSDKQIEILLDNSESTSTFADKVTKTCAGAKIQIAIPIPAPTPNPSPIPTPTPQTTSVVASFGLTP